MDGKLVIAQGQAMGDYSNPVKLGFDLGLSLQQPSSFGPAISSNQDEECDDEFAEIVIKVIDALDHSSRQPPSAPTISSARRRLAVRQPSSMDGKLIIAQGQAMGDYSNPEKFGFDLGLSLQQSSSFAPAIPSNQDGECDDEFVEIVLEVIDALGHFSRQPPSAPAIPSARRRLPVKGQRRSQWKKIETRSTNDLQLSEMACPGFPKTFLKFYDRVYALVDDPATDSIISWGKSNKSFVIWNQEELIRRNMLLRFRCRTITKFISKLKHNGFKEIKGSSGGQLEFGNRRFMKGHPELLWLMHANAVDARMRAIEAKAKVNDGLQNLEI